MRYNSNSGAVLAEELLRHVLECHDGDLFIGTLTAVGRYWRDVLSLRTRCVQVATESRRITVTNTGTRDLEALPLEIDLGNGKRHLRLVDVPADATITVEV